MEYLLEHPERAVAFFEKAKPLQPERNFVVVHGTIPTGIERLIEAAKSGKSLTPEIVRKGDEKAKLILMLADVYHEGEQWQASLDLCTRVIDGAAPKASREQKSYAYFRRGTKPSDPGHGDPFNPDCGIETTTYGSHHCTEGPVGGQGDVSRGEDFGTTNTTWTLPSRSGVVLLESIRRARTQIGPRFPSGLRFSFPSSIPKLKRHWDNTLPNTPIPNSSQMRRHFSTSASCDS